MRIRLFACSLLLSFLASNSLGRASAKQSGVIELAPKTSGSKIATISVSDESLLYQSNESSEAVFTERSACMLKFIRGRTV